MTLSMTKLAGCHGRAWLLADLCSTRGEASLPEFTSRYAVNGLSGMTILQRLRGRCFSMREYTVPATGWQGVHGVMGVGEVMAGHCKC